MARIESRRVHAPEQATLADFEWTGTNHITKDSHTKILWEAQIEECWQMRDDAWSSIMLGCIGLEGCSAGRWPIQSANTIYELTNCHEFIVLGNF